MDIARWALIRGLPMHVFSTGGKHVYQNDQETPRTQLATFDYGDCQIVFDVRALLTPGEGDVRRTDHFVGKIAGPTTEHFTMRNAKCADCLAT